MYFPVEILTFAVVKRHTNDMMFNVKLKEALYKGESILQFLAEE